MSEQIDVWTHACFTARVRTVHVHVHERSVIETRQSKATMPEDNSLFLKREKNSCLKWDSNPRRSAYQADALPTEPPRQLSWAGRIFKCYAKAKSSLP